VPIFDRFAEAAPVLKVRYLDRDAHRTPAGTAINAATECRCRVLHEDGQEAAVTASGRSANTGYWRRSWLGRVPDRIVAAGDPLLAQITQDWLDEFGGAVDSAVVPGCGSGMGIEAVLLNQ